MKKHLFTFEIATFSVILFFFILPPLFIKPVSSESEIFSQWSFPFIQTLYAFFAALLCYFFYEPVKKWLKIFPFLFSFCMLFCSALFLKGISCLFEGITASEVKVELPDTFLSWIFCLLNFLCAGFYEEVLYRMYFPEALYTLAGCKIKWKYLKIFCEAAACLAFAFAHLYLGFFAVINAALAHVILRWCLKFSGNLWSGVAAHFVYNVISLILL